MSYRDGRRCMVSHGHWVSHQGCELTTSIIGRQLNASFTCSGEVHMHLVNMIYTGFCRLIWTASSLRHTILAWSNPQSIKQRLSDLNKRPFSHTTRLKSHGSLTAKNLYPLLSRMVGSKFAWIGFLVLEKILYNMVNVISLCRFHLDLGKGVALHFNKLASLHPRMLCAKFGSNWPGFSSDFLKVEHQLFLLPSSRWDWHGPSTEQTYILFP